MDAALIVSMSRNGRKADINKCIPAKARTDRLYRQLNVRAMNLIQYQILSGDQFQACDADGLDALLAASYPAT
jgi:hypothetical protein